MACLAGHDIGGLGAGSGDPSELPQAAHVPVSRLTIGAWNNESSFNALVQGTLISGAGKAVTALRQKSKAEDGESLEGLVDQILDGQKDAAAEAE